MDGGVSSNDFVMQLTADLFGRKVARPQHLEMSCLGAAFVAGLGIGMETHTQHVHYHNYGLKLLCLFWKTGVSCRNKNLDHSLFLCVCIDGIILHYESITGMFKETYIY